MQRHKGHMAAGALLRMKWADAGSGELTSRVQGLFSECREIATAAKKDKVWPAAISALRELRSSLELLGRMSGELSQTPGVCWNSKRLNTSAK